MTDRASTAPQTAAETRQETPFPIAVRRAMSEWLLPSWTMRRSPWAPAAGLLYVATIGALGGLRVDHVFLGMLGLLDLYNEKTRLFLRAFSPLILTGAIFDGMRYFYWEGIAGRVHVAEPYLLERAWFSVGGRTLNELFLEHHWPALDLACGFAYLVFVGEYVGLAILLFFRGREDAAQTFARCFLLVNVMGFATYFVYPAAPPWYVTAYGFGPARMHIEPAAAAAQRFDALLGTHLFADMYGRGIDVFGAFPSLHVSYPLIAALLAFRLRELKWARAPAVLFFLLMCLSAVYLQHHYLIDVLLGIAYALVALGAVSALERRAGGRPSGAPA
ncbi:phosphatase PAP2 family protein [Anaeromyxobacter oryzae]|uniref:Aureobasidin A resistance protein n=1 Tax=Anaeromyxobacter oryzae TaxID=2918170 RepID=A0ABN6MTL1_9BACT|nr:phosphatase PAP2 family protein [Anaeromyxobacter oryzae]BDG03826.1 aureobasidin A resistance protein [Anaeromyxobacter oryzae]